MAHNPSNDHHGHNPDGLVKRFMDRNPFKVPIKTVDIRQEHVAFGCIKPGEKPFTITEV